MLGDLVRHAPLGELLRSAEPARAHHDHERVDLVGTIDDRLPGRRTELGRRFGVEARLAGTDGARTGCLDRPARFRSSKAPPGSADVVSERLSAAVSTGPTSSTIARRGPRTAAATLIARRDDSESS